MNANGKLTNAELTTVIGGRLSNATAAAWNAMVAAAAHDGVALIIAGAAGNTGSGAYRDYWTQNDMRVHPALYGLSSYSTVTIARAGYSTHGLGTSLDIGSFPPASRLSAYGTQVSCADHGCSRMRSRSDSPALLARATPTILGTMAPYQLPPKAYCSRLSHQLKKRIT